MDIQRLNPTPRWSDATVFNNMAHFVEIANDTSGDVREQVKQIFAQAESTLSQVNSNKLRILSATVYVTDFSHMQQLNEEWEAWFPQGCAPSRACVKVELADPSYLVEISFVAAVITAQA